MSRTKAKVARNFSAIAPTVYWHKLDGSRHEAMNHNRHDVVLAIFVAVCCLGRSQSPATAEPAPAGSALFNQDSHKSRGFGTDAARVDSQITLNIPGGQAGAVYAYLRSAYADKNELLEKKFPSLPLHGNQKIDVSVFTDQYFDTPNLDLYQKQNSARYRTRINTTDKSDPKSGRELVQVKVTPPAGFVMRTELKFAVKPSKKPRDIDDFHPLIGRIDRQQREDFKEAIERLGLNPLALQRTLTIQQQRSRVYVYWGKENILSFSVDEYQTRILWTTARSASVDVGLVENVFTEADEAKRKSLREIRDFMVRDLKEHFPTLEQTTKEKYCILLEQIMGQLPGFQFLLKHKLT